MTEEEKQLKEDEKWLKSVQKKFMKLISNLKWDCIELSNLQYDIISHIMNCKSVKKLSPSINERVVDQILETIKNKFNKVKFSKQKSEDENEREF